MHLPMKASLDSLLLGVGRGIQFVNYSVMVGGKVRIHLLVDVGKC